MQQETFVDERAVPSASDYQTGGYGPPPEWPPPSPIKVCRECSAQAQTDGGFCPHCGASYARRKRVTRRVKVALAVALLLVLAAGGTAGVLLKLDHDDKVAAKKHAAAVAAQQKADDAKRRADEKRASDGIERSSRADLVKSLERSVTKDAEKDVSLGLIDGPVLRTECNPTAGSDPKDLAATTGDFSCLAVTTENADGTASGYRFSATVNYDQFNYTWHLGG